MEIKFNRLIIFGLLAYVLYLHFNSYISNQEYKNNIASLVSDNKTYIKNGLEHTESMVVEMSKKQFESIKDLKGELKTLQDVVKKTPRLISATVLNNNTKTDISAPIDTIVAHDTVIMDDRVYINSSYKYDISDKWHLGKAIASKDSLKLDLLTRNEYEITFQKSKFKLLKPFKKRESIVTVKNLNPNTYTTGLQSFNVECKHKPLKNSLISGGVGFVGGFILGSR